MELESLKLQLLNSLNGLKQQEKALIISEINESEQNESINQFQKQLAESLSILNSLPNNFSSSSKLIHSVYSLASDLSWRIKEVDIANSRCKETALHIKRFADLSECLGSIDSTIIEGDIKRCCNYIYRLRQIPKNLLSPDNENKIEVSRQKTLELLRHKMQSETDPATIFEYFNECGAQSEGISEFAILKHQEIVSKTDPDRISLVQLPTSGYKDEQRAPHIEVFVKLLDCISSHIITSIQVLNDPGLFSIFIRLLLELNDNRIEGIVKQYNSYRNINDLPQNTPPSYLDLINDEISIFSQQYSLFENFLKQKLKGGISSNYFKSFQFKYPTILSTGLPQHTLSKRSIQELLAMFVVITQSYLNSVNEEFFGIISSLSNNENVLNAIEDLFFVFQRLLSRSILSNSASTACTTFNIISGIIRDQLVVIIIQQSNLIKSYDISGKVSLLLNTYDNTFLYISKLVSSVESSILKSFSGDDLIAIKPNLEDLKKCGESLLKVKDKLFEEIIKNIRPHIEALSEIFKTNQWTIEQGKLITVELETQLQNSFIKIFNSNFLIYKNYLNFNLYDKFKNRIALLFSKKFKEILLQKKFDQKGVKLLERMIKFFSTFFNESEAFEIVLPKIDR